MSVRHILSYTILFWQIAQSFVNDTVNIIDVYFKDVKSKVSNFTCIHGKSKITQLATLG